MPAPTGNSYAAKPAGEGATSKLDLRCTPSDKAAWVRAAASRAARDQEAKAGLAAWVIDTLNAAASTELDRRSR